MEEIKLSDIDIKEMGITIQIAGIIWSGLEKCFITQFPGKSEDFTDIKLMPMDLSEWESLLRQTDLLETEILALDPSNRVVKAIYRRTQRNIDSYVQWAVFQRDNYTCRYCGKTGIPLSVDHIDLWENGGATIKDNLLTACKSCNKHRGRTPYAEWIKSPYYIHISAHLPEAVKQANLDVVNQLPKLEARRVVHVRTR